VKIFVNNPPGDIITLEVESSDTLADLKAKIQENTGIPPDHQVFIHGKELEGGWALVDCNIQNESNSRPAQVHLVG